MSDRDGQADDGLAGLPAHRRLKARLAGGLTRLRGPVISDAQPVWVWQMTVILIAASAAVVVLIGFDLDAGVTEWVRAWHSPLRDFMISHTDIALSQWYIYPAAVLVLIAALADWGAPGSGGRKVWANIYTHALFLVAAMGTALMLTNIGKLVIGRGRPLFFDEYGILHLSPFAFNDQFASFPSGHSTNAAALTIILMMWLPRLRYLILAAGLFLAASRVAAQAHYPSDVIAGFTVGTLVTILWARWLAARGVAFETRPGRLFPHPRTGRSVEKLA